MASMKDVLADLVNMQVTVVNPQSYVESVMKDSLRMETYEAKVVEIGDDYIRLHYEAKKKQELQEVDQIIPIVEVKRISRWGDERILHL